MTSTGTPIKPGSFTVHTPCQPLLFFYFRPHHQFRDKRFSPSYIGNTVEPIFGDGTLTIVYPSENPLNPGADSGFASAAIHLFRCGFLHLFYSGTMQFLAK